MRKTVDPKLKQIVMEASGEKSIRSCLIESVDATFHTILGAHASDALYSNLEDSGIARSDIPDELDSFCSTIQEKCGPNGGFMIQHAIAKQLYAKLGFAFALSGNRNLADYVHEAQRDWLRLNRL